MSRSFARATLRSRSAKRFWSVNGTSSLAERKEILVRQRDLLAKRLAAQQAVLEKLDAKIANYEERCVVWERTHLRGDRQAKNGDR